MKYLPFILITIVAISLIYFLVSRGTENELQSPIQKPGQSGLETKTDDQGQVNIKITPNDLSAQSKEWRFNVVMDTHSVELDQDMTKNSILIDNNGNEYMPSRWEGGTGGHHREGVLIFAPLNTTLEFIELKILGVGGVIRNFNWQL